MGYSYRGEIKTFWPDDTDNEFFIPESTSLGEIIRRIKEKWPGVKIGGIQITSENIHTDCLGYDLHVSSDYTCFIKISKE